MVKPHNTKNDLPCTRQKEKNEPPEGGNTSASYTPLSTSILGSQVLGGSCFLIVTHEAKDTALRPHPSSTISAFAQSACRQPRGPLLAAVVTGVIQIRNCGIFLFEETMYKNFVKNSLSRVLPQMPCAFYVCIRGLHTRRQCSRRQRAPKCEKLKVHVISSEG